MNRRTEETREKLQQAFVALLQTKSYEAITMEDIARQANRTRVTVYRHYGDKEAMLLDCFSNTIETLKDDLTYPNEAPEKSASQLSYANILIFYTHAAVNRPLYYALFCSSASSTVQPRFRRVIAGIINIHMHQEGTLAAMPAPPSMVANLLAGLIVGAMVWWLESKSDYEPSLLAEVVVRMSETGVFGLTGQTVLASDMSFRPFAIPPVPSDTAPLPSVSAAAHNHERHTTKCQ